MTTTNQTPPEGFTELGPGREYRTLPFFLLVFGSWLVWIPAGARMAGKLPFYFPTEVAWLGVFAPMILGTWFTYRYGGARALRIHLWRFVQWRFEGRFWFFAVFAMPLVATLTAVLYSVAVEPILAEGWSRLLDGSVMEAALERYRGTNYESIGFFSTLNTWMGSGALAFVVGSLLLGFVDGGISEEPGWRGFAYPILRDRWGSLPAALLIGIVWAAWHLGPHQWAILFGEGKEAFFAFLPGYAATYILATTPLAIIFAWLYEKTSGSLLALFLVHNSFNQTSLTFGFMFPDAPVILGVVAFLWVMVVVILVKQGWRAFGGASGPGPGEPGIPGGAGIGSIQTPSAQR